MVLCDILIMLQATVDQLGRRDLEVMLVSVDSREDLVQREALVHQDQRVTLDLRVHQVIQDHKETEATKGLRGLLVLRERGVMLESKGLKVPQDNQDHLGQLDPLGQLDK